MSAQTLCWWWALERRASKLRWSWGRLAACRRVSPSEQPTSHVLSKVVPAIFAGKNPVLRLLGLSYWNFMHRVVTIDTPLGRKAKSQIALRGQPLIRLNRADALAAG